MIAVVFHSSAEFKYNRTGLYIVLYVKKQPSQDILQGDAAEEELGLACLVSSYCIYCVPRVS